MKRNDKGSITIEAMLLVPTIFLFSSLIVYVGRMTDAAITVRRAADVAARVASQANEQSANYRAIQTVKHEIGSLTSGCNDSDVHVQKVKRNWETTYVAKVNCSINTRGLGLLSLIPKTVSAESSEIVDVYTAR
jgi:Flp pilus assembly protein TadG